ncbi:hypothetical protein HHI36_015800 [Cryptolaemus montrouzieri]|uniref:Uncharacterized protein n=1 Tax=Cryptolaemus montrouzieri TaxID=559131 RepID=A0ABD2N7H3_9CUCU
MDHEYEQLSRVKKRCAKKQICVNTTNLHAGKVDILNRCVLNQKQYMKVLAVPNIRCFNKPCRIRKHRCIEDRCSPRIMKLALPTKVQVLGTWKNHQYSLKSEFIQRLHDLLHADNNLNIRDMRYYFKRFDRKKKRKMKIAMKKKMQQEELMDAGWLKDEVRILSRLIVDYFLEEPVLDLSFKQLMISSIIMNFMSGTAAMKHPLSRNSTKTYPLTILEICDKLAVWLDSVVKLVDFQPIDDDEEFPSEIFDYGEEEGEEFYGMMEDYGEEGITQVEGEQ